MRWRGAEGVRGRSRGARRGADRRGRRLLRRRRSEGAGRRHRLFPVGRQRRRPAARAARRKPVIAAIEGHACAGGLGVALFCDIRIVDETAAFGVFSRRWGVPMSDGTTVRLPRIVGQGRALDMLLTGRAVGADEAIAIGLATRKVARGTTRAEAEKLARRDRGLPADRHDVGPAIRLRELRPRPGGRDAARDGIVAGRTAAGVAEGCGALRPGRRPARKIRGVMMRALVCEAYGSIEVSRSRTCRCRNPRRARCWSASARPA